jgi:hypothetical protein
MRTLAHAPCVVHRIAVLVVVAVAMASSSSLGGGGITGVAAAMTDPATGIAFAPKVGGLEVFGVGVRKKGPIKVRCYRSRVVKSNGTACDSFAK